MSHTHFTRIGNVRGHVQIYPQTWVENGTRKAKEKMVSISILAPLNDPSRMTSRLGEQEDGDASQKAEDELDIVAEGLSEGEAAPRATSSSSQAKLSKNAQKKLLKAQRLEELKPAKRKAERERRKVRRAEAKQAGLPVPPRLRAPPAGRSKVKATLVIDLGFDNLMTEKVSGVFEKGGI